MSDPSPLLRRLADCVRERRRRHGWSRGELARQAGLSVRFLAKVESGDGNISVLRLEALAQALGTSPDRLIQPSADRAPIIALTGMRGAGKSTVGPLLAEQLQRPFVEMDSKIVESAGLPTSQIFELHGERYYRRLESETLDRLLEQGRSAVVATAGGLVTEARTWRRLCRRTYVIWLKAEAEDHWNRVVAQGDSRPMQDNPEAMSQLRALLAARESAYAQAWKTVETSGRAPEEIAAEISQAFSLESAS